MHKTPQRRTKNMGHTTNLSLMKTKGTEMSEKEFRVEVSNTHE